jgi:hypothetical protein
MYWSDIAVTEREWNAFDHSALCKHKDVKAPASTSSVLQILQQFLPSTILRNLVYGNLHLNRPTNSVNYARLIKILRLSGISTPISATAWKSMVHSLSTLEEIVLEGNITVMADTMAFKLGAKSTDATLPCLRTLSMSNCANTPTVAVRYLLHNAPNLAELHLAGNSYDELSLCSLIECTSNIEVLSLGSENSAKVPFASSTGLGKVKGNFLAIIIASFCKKLRELKLGGTYSLSSIAFAALVVVSEPIYDSSEDMKLYHTSGLPFDRDATLESLRRSTLGAKPDLGRLCRLEKLALYSATTHFSDDIHRVILSDPTCCSNLRSLTLADAHSITNHTLASIIHHCMGTLNNLELIRLNITDDGLAACLDHGEHIQVMNLRGLPKVENLATIIGGEGALPSLISLELREMLNLREGVAEGGEEEATANITDEVTDSTETLVDDGDGVNRSTSTPFSFRVGCKNLLRLNIYDCPKIDDQMLVKFEKALPSATVVLNNAGVTADYNR